jgi:hypothetical protein
LHFELKQKKSSHQGWTSFVLPVRLCGLFLKLLEDAHCSVEDGVVVEANGTAIGTLLEVNTCGSAALEVATAKIVSYFICIAAYLVCDALHASAGQFVLDATQFIKGCNHSDIKF